MLELHNILWVIPGVIFIHLYNRRRPAKHEVAINLSGWPLIFALAIIASLTWLPEYKSKTDFTDREIIIPRSEIITFGKFNKEVFNHFYKDNSSNENS